MAQFLTAAITIFDENRNIDKEKNKKYYEHLIAGNIDGIVLMGSTGEFFSLGLTESKELINLAIDTIKKRTRLLVGTMRMSIKETIELSNYALRLGADGVMLVSPYYFKLSQENIENFFDKVIPNIDGKVYIYNFPGVTGYNIEPKTLLSLCRKYSNIAGFKDTVTEMGHTRNIIKTITKEFPDFEVYSGYDEFFLQNVTSGGAGCIGGLPNLLPDFFSEWSKDFRNKNYEEAFKKQKFVNELMELFEICSPFIPAIKKAMVLKGLDITEYNTYPFLSANEEQSKKIEVLLKRLNII